MEDTSFACALYEVNEVIRDMEERLKDKMYSTLHKDEIIEELLKMDQEKNGGGSL